MAYRAHTVGRLVRLVLAWTWAGAAADRSCSQYPGFAEYFAEHLRSSPPTRVIRRWRAAMRRASICLPDTRVRCDFYRDHIAHGCLVTGNGVRIEGPTPAEPNRHRDDPLAEFVRVPGGSDAPRPVVYASVERTELWTPRDAGGTAEEFIVATYHLVFRASDLPARLPAAAEASLGLVRTWTTGISSTTTRPRSWCSTPASVRSPSTCSSTAICVPTSSVRRWSREAADSSTSTSRSGRTSSTRGDGSLRNFQLRNL